MRLPTGEKSDSASNFQLYHTPSLYALHRHPHPSCILKPTTRTSSVWNHAHLSKMSTCVLNTQMCGPVCSASASISSAVATSAATARLVRLRAMISKHCLATLFLASPARSSYDSLAAQAGSTGKQYRQVSRQVSRAG
jgi:hypothetical protein